MAERFGFGRSGPEVLPGEYDVVVKAGSSELEGTVRVDLDPKVQASETDLAAQLEASLALGELQGRVNTMIERLDDIVGQLTSLDKLLGSQTPPPAYREDVKQAVEKLKSFRDTELARPLAGLGYRQYPRLREDVMSLTRSVGRGFRPLNEGEKLRMKELEGETDQAVTKLNAIIDGEIAKINEATQSLPRIVADPVK